MSQPHYSTILLRHWRVILLFGCVGLLFAVAMTFVRPLQYSSTVRLLISQDVGASVDGVRVTRASATDVQAFAGIADSDIANNAYGLLQVYGYRASIAIYASTGSSVAGDNLVCVASQWGMTPATTLGTSKAFGFLCAAVTASSSSQFLTTAAAFIRAL